MYEQAIERMLAGLNIGRIVCMCVRVRVGVCVRVCVCACVCHPAVVSDTLPSLPLTTSWRSKGQILPVLMISSRSSVMVKTFSICTSIEEL
jgi:hypothetical protein